ncbi:hypothetical protein ACHAW5_009077 [Stephanodiscus triporus]|uniref:Histone-binding protein RBBP4-like N-terminal domain-containing protein n=1 Tax=Stephanodiscus triporus TaxID=2934178 RepID=A0ABD3NEP2_9STRA
MGKKTKRSGHKSGDSDDMCRDGSNNVVSDGEISNNSTAASPTTPASAVADDNDDDLRRRRPPALRPVVERRAVDEGMQDDDDDDDDDDYEDDDDDYEDVYESSGDEGHDDDEAHGDAFAPPGDPSAAPADVPSRVRAWNPFLGEADASKLEMDETAYKMHHALTPEWPSLTLDVVPDRFLGDNRTRFPHTVTLVVGSQADVPGRNKLSVLRLSDLCRVPGSLGREKSERELDDEMLGEEWRHDDEEDGKDDDDNDESSDDEEEEEEERDPILEHYSFPHPSGGINRVRVCPHNSDVVAVWGESGTVSLYDIGGALDLLDRSGSNARNNNDNNNNNNGKKSDKKKEIIGPPVRRMRKDPFFVYSGHSTEGYAIDWSRVTPGRLATADRDGNVHVWDATHPVARDDDVACTGGKRGGGGRGGGSPWGNSSFVVKPTYSAHGDNLDAPSVEDLQWSPTESTVLASGECGGYVRIYDVRCPGRAMISNKVHANGADVNVISWNGLVGNLLASGGDDGTFSVWDLRNFKTPDPSVPPRPLARFRSHRTPITSLEWHPTDESMIAVSDDRGTYIYDLSIEEDDPDAVAAAGRNEGEGGRDDGGGGVEGEIPPQLLFVHSGSEMTKEIFAEEREPNGELSG